MTCQKILNSISNSYQNILKENLVGIYVHGSIALGCFHWDKSDIDFLVVTHKELSREVKRRLMDCTMQINEQAPQKGLEVSIVLKRHCKKFIYPTPFELHFSNMHKEWYQNSPEDYCDKMQGKDKDLAAHFTIIKHAGIVLCGEPISSVFDDVPKKYYLDSIKYDVQEARCDIFTNPVYVILNLCRVIAYAQKGFILSKEQGGKWGIENLNSHHKPLINRALHSYQTDKKMEIMQDEAEPFCDDMLDLIFRV